MCSKIQSKISLSLNKLYWVACNLKTPVCSKLNEHRESIQGKSARTVEVIE